MCQNMRKSYWKIRLSQDGVSNPLTNQLVGMYQRKKWYRLKQFLVSDIRVATKKHFGGLLSL